MTPEQQRIAIAEACGYDMKVCPSHRSTSCCGRPMIPNYLNDLNAMHEAENTLDCSEFFETELIRACKDYPFWHATAAQRAEAFLRTLGRWVES